VKTDVQPDEAALYLDGKLIGTADDFDGYPDLLYLRKGNYSLEFRLDGYEPLSVTVNAAPGRFFRIDQRLKKIKGAKRTDIPVKIPGGIIRYYAKRGGVAVPYTPGSGGYVENSPAPAEGESEDMAPPPAPPDNLVQPAHEEADEGRIFFHVAPFDTAIYVDDHFAGSAKDLNALRSGLAVSPGTHRVSLIRPGYRAQEINLDVEPNVRSEVDVKLSR
jgi:hypothetical protein